MNMKKILLLVLFVATLQTTKAQTFNVNLAQKLQDTLDYMVSTNVNTKGVSASVYYPGQGIWRGASGISNVGVPITTNMILGLASNSKVYTALVLIKLAESNTLSLNDSLFNWIPNYPNINPNTTIRQLLNHQSGISDMYLTQTQMDTILNYPNHNWLASEVLGIVGPPQFAPGAGYYYSNTNTILAGMVAESATGFHISQLIRDSILTPLQLDSTFYLPNETIVGTVATPWKNGNVNVIPLSFTSAVGPAGAMYAKASEVCQLYKALMGGQIINANSLADMTTFGPSNYGLGIQKYSFNGRTVWGHGGINPEGYRTRVIYDPCSGAAICGLSNSNPSGIDGVTVLLHKVLVTYLPSCPDSVAGLTTVCQGQTSVVYTVPLITNATSYIWTLPNDATGVSNTNTITVDYGANAVSGNISVVGSNMYGESPATTLQIIVNPLPATPVISISGDTLTSNAPLGNQWYNSSGVIVGATNATYTITSSDNYYCIVTLLGCSSDTSNNINALLTNVNETFLQNNLKIYPNPSSSDITFQTNIRLNNATLVLTDYSGRTVAKINNISDYSFILHRTNLDNGLYFVQLIEDNRIIAMKKLVLID